MPRVIFYPFGKEISVPENRTLLEAAQKAGVLVNASCGGKGVCGKCKVILEEGQVDEAEHALLTTKERKENYILACQTRVIEDVRVRVPIELELISKDQTKIQTLITKRDIWNKKLEQIEADGLVNKYFLELPVPSIEDSKSDTSRIKNRLRQIIGNQHQISFEHEIIRNLGDILRDSDYRVTATVHEKNGSAEIVRIEPGNTYMNNYAITIDVGTTSIKAQLIDLNNRRIIEESSDYNSQISYGEDVLSRMVFALKGKGLNILQEKVIDTINGIINRLVEKSGVARNDISHMIAAGNTVMVHILIGVNPKYIRSEPYIPVFKFPPPLKCSDIGIEINNNAPLVIFPSVASYLGADITAGLAAAEFWHQDKLTLYIDIGTNGELVLGNSEWLVGCSCSAGPAFEGGGVKNGLRCATGAIEKVSIDRDTLEVAFQTYGGTLVRGICGSGLIDLMAELFLSGIINGRGKIDLDLDTDRTREGNYGPEFVVAWKEQSESGQDIVITEVDIDNLMRAKAAVYAGITTLVESVGLNIDNIEEVILAGTFGNYIRVKEAVTIGLLPDIDLNKYRFIGNGSLLGSTMAAVNQEYLNKAKEFAEKISYLELSVHSGFMDKYMSALFLPHTDRSLFPSV